MELINIVYRYLNRYINSEELVKLLENIDKTKFSPKEQEDLVKILVSVKNVIATVPIEEDKYEVYLRTSREQILKKLEEVNDYSVIVTVGSGFEEIKNELLKAGFKNIYSIAELLI